jgi:hypothetical protein
MIIDCHVHAGGLNKHYPIWWIEELYRVWGGVHQWTYNGPTIVQRCLSANGSYTRWISCSASAACRVSVTTPVLQTRKHPGIAAHLR